MLLAQFFCVGILVAAASAENFTWLGLATAGTSVQPPARHSAAMGAWDGNFYVFGGKRNKFNGTDVLGDIWRVTIANTVVMWDMENVIGGPGGRYSTVYGVMENYLLVSHGRGESESDVYSDTWALDMETLEWLAINTTHNAAIPEGRFDAAGGMYGNKLWLSMGRNKDKRILSDTWVLSVNFSTDTGELVGDWELVDEGVGLNQYNMFLPHARFRHAGVPLNESTFVIFGGCSSGGFVGGPCPLGDSWLFDREEGEWTKLDDCSTPTNDAVMIRLSINRGLLVMGDEEGGLGAYPQYLSGTRYNSSDLSLVDVDNETWVVTVGMGSAFPRKRADPAIAQDGNTILIFGGRTVEGEETVMADVWQLTWTREDGEERGCLGVYFSFVHLHGVLMYLAWGLMLPLGALLGRYYRHYWPVWFILHIIAQSLGVLLTVAGFVLIFLVGSYSEPNFTHAIVGIVLTAMLLQQFLSGIFHPCVDRENGQTPKEEKSVYRRCWEVYHATSGFLSIALGLGQVTLGVFLVAPPSVVWVVWCALGLSWLLTFFLHEVGHLICKIRHRVKKDNNTNY